MMRTSALQSVCRRYPIAKLRLFGSRARGTAKRNSDYDLLVDFTPDHQPTLLSLGGLQSELSKVFDAPVDLLCNSPSLPRKFTKDAKVLFERNRATTDYTDHTDKSA
jgi:predicted nucleotidyltransferase